MHQPAPGKPYVEPNITINGQRLNAVDKFTYLAAHFPEMSSLMTKSTPDSLMRGPPSADFTKKRLEQERNHDKD